SPNRRGYTILTPWEVSPYQLIDWWAMQQFSAEYFYNMAVLLQQLMKQFELASEKLSDSYSLVDGTMRMILDKSLLLIENECVELSLSNSIGVISELRTYLLAEKIQGGFTDITLSQLSVRFDEVDRAIRREMKLHLFMYVPIERAEYYQSYGEPRRL